MDGATKAVYGGTSTHVIAQQKNSTVKLSKIIKKMKHWKTRDWKCTKCHGRKHGPSHNIFTSTIFGISGDQLEKNLSLDSGEFRKCKLRLRRGTSETFKTQRK